MIVQGHWHDASSLLQLPSVTKKTVKVLAAKKIVALPQLASMPSKKAEIILREVLKEKKVPQVMKVLSELPIIDVATKLGMYIFTTFMAFAYPTGSTRAGQEAKVVIDLRRVTKLARNGIHSQKFPKRMDEAYASVS